MRCLPQRMVPTILACVFIALPAVAQDGAVNAVTRIERVAGGVVIVVTSSTPFPGRAWPPLLHVGDRAFGRSRSPADGSLGTLIFMLSEDEFAETRTGDRLIVAFRGSPRETGWDFGVLDKSALGREQ
jgi:hypothetical protein